MREKSPTPTAISFIILNLSRFISFSVCFSGFSG